MKRGLLTIAVAIASLPAIDCAASARGPEAVPIDRAECARCRMLISSERGAGQIVSSSQETRFYDDVGCLAADWARSGATAAKSAAEAHAFVRLDSGTWLDAGSASYAQPTGARTAMGSGFVAVASIAEARAADRGGRALTFDDVLRLSGGQR